MEWPMNEDLPQKKTRPRQGSSQARETETDSVAKLEDRLNKKKAFCEQTRRKLKELNDSIIEKQTMKEINNEEAAAIEKKLVKCITWAKNIFTTFEKTLPGFQDFEVEVTAMEEKLEPLEDRILKKSEEYSKKVEERTQFVNRLRAENQLREETVKKENERLLKDIETKKIELKMLCEQEAMEEEDEFDEEKCANEIIDLENDLRVAKEELIKVQEETQQFKATQAEAEKTFNETISDLQARDKEISCDLSQTEQQLQNLEDELNHKKILLQKLKQEDQQMKDAINDCVLILENDEYSKLESEIKTIRAENAAGEVLLNAATEELTKLTKSVQDEDEEIKNSRLEIEKLKVELKAVKEQKNLLNINNLENIRQYDELCAKKATLAEKKIALQNQISGIEDDILKVNKEIKDQTEEEKLKLLSLEKIHLQEIQEKEKILALLVEKSSDLQNKETQMKTQLKELLQKEELSKEKLASITMTEEESGKELKNLSTTYKAMMKEKRIIKKKLGLYPAPPPIVVQQSATVKPKIPEIRNPHVPVEKPRKRRREVLPRPRIPLEESFNSDSTTDGESNDLLKRLRIINKPEARSSTLD